MATTPQKPADSSAPKSESHAPKPPLKAEDAAALFRNGSRLAKMGDPPEKWFSMGRTPEGVAVLQTPLSDALVKEIETGSYYLVPDHPIPDHPAAGG